MKVRKNYTALSDKERAEFVNTLKSVKAAGLVDAFADMHARHFAMGIHRSSHFLPWHREMLLRFEEALDATSPGIATPYWDSSTDGSPSGRLWRTEFLGQFDGTWNLGRAFGASGAVLPTPSEVETTGGLSTYRSFWPSIEWDIHNPPHSWVGGKMAQIDSPRDPAFYLHHCWIDMLWAKWQRRFPEAPFQESGPEFGLHDPLMEWPDRTPADVLDYKKLGYMYDFEVPPRWDSLAGVKTSGPAAVLQTGGRLVVFARGEDNAVWHRWQVTPNGDWAADWESIGAPPGGASSGPAAAMNAPGGLVAFARGTDNAIWHAWQDHPNGTWW